MEFIKQEKMEQIIVMVNKKNVIKTESRIKDDVLLKRPIRNMAVHIIPQDENDLYLAEQGKYMQIVLKYINLSLKKLKVKSNFLITNASKKELAFQVCW
jgi:protein tyrosine phosphatase